MRILGVIGICLSAVLALGPAPAGAAASDSAVYVELRPEGGGADAATERWKLYGASHALVIGIDDYSNGWPRLSNAVRDAEAVGAGLEAKGFEVELLRNPKSSELRSALRAFFARKGNDPDARLFLWYAGHGHTEYGEGYLVPSDAPLPGDPEFLFQALHMGDIGSMVRIARSKHVFAVFDSCFAGTIFNASRARPPASVTRAVAEPVRQFLTSGDADQEVSDDGTFRDLFLRALNGEEDADANRDGYLTGTELSLYIEDRVINLTNSFQTPRSGKLRDRRFDQGDFIFLLPKPEEVQVAAAVPAETVSDNATRALTQADRDLAIELAFWDSIKGSDSASDYQAYLATYPEGQFAPLAEARLAQLEARVAELEAQQARLQAEAEARAQEDERRRQAEEAARQQAAEQALARAELEERLRAEAEARQRAEAEVRRQAVEAARREAEAEARRQAEEVARQQAEAEARRLAEQAERQQAEAEERRLTEEATRQQAEAAAEAQRQAEEERAIQLAALPPEPQADPAEQAELALNLNRSDRKELQQALSALGYDTNGIDGFFGQGTRGAIRDYQAAKGAEQTGYLTASLASTLLAEAPKPVANPAPQQAPQASQPQVAALPSASIEAEIRSVEAQIASLRAAIEQAGAASGDPAFPNDGLWTGQIVKQSCSKSYYSSGTAEVRVERGRFETLSSPHVVFHGSVSGNSVEVKTHTPSGREAELEGAFSGERFEGDILIRSRGANCRFTMELTRQASQNESAATAALEAQVHALELRLTQLRAQ